MLLDKKFCKILATDLVLLIVSVLYLIGIRCWFPVCPVGETVMACHWAGETLKALSVLLTVLAAVRLLVPELRIKQGIGISMACTAVLTMCVPGGVINLCAADGMRCATSHSWTTAFGTVLLLVLAIDVILTISAEARKKHSRDGAQK